MYKRQEATGGTETSKYPEERKSTETPGVAASETGPETKPAQDVYKRQVKVGMVSSAEIIRAIAGDLDKWHAENIVVDPCLLYTSRCV